MGLFRNYLPFRRRKQSYFIDSLRRRLRLSIRDLDCLTASGLLRRGAEGGKIPVKGQEGFQVLRDPGGESRRVEALVQGDLMGQGQGFLLVPGAQQVADLALAADIVRSRQLKDLLAVKLAHQLLQGLGVPVDLLAIAGHGGGGSGPEAHAIAVIVRGDLKIEGRAARPVLVPGADAEPQVVLVGSLAVEPPGVPVNAADLQDQRLMGQRCRQTVVHGLAQLTGGGQQVLLVIVLMGQEPAAFVVEADAPHEIHGLLAVSLKHSVSPLRWVWVQCSA